MKIINKLANRPLFSRLIFRSLRFALALVLAVGLIAGSSQTPSGHAQQQQAQQPLDLSDDLHTLESKPDDSPALSASKAALRLVSVFTQVQKICEKCSLEDVLSGYVKANGNSIAQVVKFAGGAGALSPEWKIATEQSVDKGLQSAFESYDCLQLSEQIKNGQWSIYKGAFEDDYNLIRKK
jgi:hypothetical protein